MVHRNGKTKKGEEIAIDEAVVDKVIRRIESFVNEIDRKLKDNEPVEETKMLTLDPEDIDLEDF